MKKIAGIFIRDLKKIGRNPIALIVAAGIMVLPSLYAWFNIAANWDPYGNTKGLKVAVSNEDQGVTLTDLELDVNIGDMIVSNLRANEQIGWQFVDKDTAMNGVESGGYYACVIIPEDFSTRITSFLTKDVEKPAIEYYVNEKKNAIATKITDKGVSSIQQQVNESFISAASEAMGKILNTSSQEVSRKKTDTADDVLSVLDDARLDLDMLGSSFSSLKSSLLAVQDMMGAVQSGLPDADLLLEDGKEAADRTQSTINASRRLSATVTDSIDSVLEITGHLTDNLDSGASDAAEDWKYDTRQMSASLERLKGAASDLMNVNNQLIFAIQTISNKLPLVPSNVSDILSQLSASVQKQKELIAKLDSFQQTLKETGALPQEAIDDMESAVQEIRTENGRIRDEYRQNARPAIADSVDQIYDSMDQVTRTLEQAGGLVSRLDSTLTSADSSFTTQADALDQAIQAVNRGKERLQKMIDEISKVSDNEKLNKLLELLQNDPQEMSVFLSAPVELHVNKIYPIENYGSAMTPFYTILSIWVGGLVLVAVLKCRVQEDDKLNGLKPHEKYFGRYLIFMVFGIVQALIVALGDLYLLKIQCLEPGKFLLAAITASIVFTNMIYTLTISFGDVGKAVAVVLLVIQVAGAGGTFPIEVTPHFFRTVNPLLPFTHAINAMRECIGGMYGSAYVYDLIKVLCYLPVSLFVGIVLRKPLLWVNEFFEEKLEETGIM